MTDAGTDLEVVWAVLETQGGDVDGLRVRGTGVELPAGEILVASGPDGHRHVLLPLTESAGFAQDTATRGVHITRRRLDTGRGLAEFVDVECRLSHLNPIFVTLADEMVTAATAAPNQPATACRLVLDHWREFLGADRPQLLSEDKAVGLLAELLVLFDVLSHDPDRRLDVWAGPSGAVHDLRRNAHAIEVKGTQLREGKFIEIHGAEQLAAPDAGTLHLAWYRFEKDDTSALSLPAVIREIRGLGVDNLALAERLALAGYDPGHSDEYERRRYRTVESRLYTVDGTFPRVVPSSFAHGTVPPGVLGLRYTVDLTNEPPVPLDATTTDNIHRTLGVGVTVAVLQRFAEPFPPHGALAAEGFSKLLGRPNLDPLTLLVRETAQNSWDARLPHATVRYSINGLTLDDDQWNSLANKVFADLPPEGLPLDPVLDKNPLDVIMVSDRGTLGLGGPTRADQPTDGPTDYVDLLMNVGIGGHEFGGGTYGFGKTIAYVVSCARTIIVHTRTASGLRKPETRFIASGIGDKFVQHGNRYTGRHWWGRQKDGAPEPLTGTAAENLARSIGFPGFDDEETGTSIMIIDPDFGDRDPKEAMRFVADAVTWNLWPKMVPVNGREPMHFSLSWNGDPVSVPRPEDLPPLHGFAQALAALRVHDEPFRRDDGLELIDIRAQRPNRRLGRLALYTFVTKPRPLTTRTVNRDDDDEEIEPMNAAAFTGNAHHVALLRAPELVVTYLSGPELSDTSIEWGGVFICDRDLDTAFAASEPPTHDDWQPPLVSEKSERRVVNIALRQIRNTMRSSVAVAQGSTRPGTASVARVADALAGLVGVAPGAGPGRAPKPAASAERRPRRPTITDARCGPVLLDGTRLSRLDFGVALPDPGAVRIEVRAGVATNDGTGMESDPPAGSAVPVLVRVEGPVTRDITGSVAELEADVPRLTKWTVFATSPDDVMVAFDVHVESADGSGAP